MEPPVLKVRLIEEVKALQTGNKGRRFGPRHHLISSKNQGLPTQYVTTNPFEPCNRNAHMHTSSYRAVIKYFVDLNVYFVCICAKGEKNPEVLLYSFPSDLHSNVLLPMTDDAGNEYCQYEGSLL